MGGPFEWTGVGRDDIGGPEPALPDDGGCSLSCAATEDFPQFPDDQKKGRAPLRETPALVARERCRPGSLTRR